MRVRGLNSFIRNEKLFNTYKLASLVNSLLLIDAKWWLYIYSARLPITQIMNGVIYNLYYMITEFIQHLKKHNIQCIFFFEGIKLNKDSYFDRIKYTNIETAYKSYLANNIDKMQDQLELALKYITDTTIEEFKLILKKLNILCIGSPYHVPGQMIRFLKGYTTNAMGPAEFTLWNIKNVILNIDLTLQTYDVFKIDSLLNKLEITYNEYIDICLLAGTDYNQTNPCVEKLGGEDAFLCATRALHKNYLTTYLLSIPNKQLQESIIKDLSAVRNWIIYNPALNDNGVLEIRMNNILSQVPENYSEIVGMQLSKSLYGFLCNLQISPILLISLSTGVWNEIDKPTIVVQDWLNVIEQLKEIRLFCLGLLAAGSNIAYIFQKIQFQVTLQIEKNTNELLKYNNSVVKIEKQYYPYVSKFTGSFLSRDTTRLLEKILRKSSTIQQTSFVTSAVMETIAMILHSLQYIKLNGDMDASLSALMEYTNNINCFKSGLLFIELLKRNQIHEKEYEIISMHNVNIHDESTQKLLDYTSLTKKLVSIHKIEHLFTEELYKNYNSCIRLITRVCSIFLLAKASIINECNVNALDFELAPFISIITTVSKTIHYLLECAIFDTIYITLDQYEKYQKKVDKQINLILENGISTNNITTSNTTPLIIDAELNAKYDKIYDRSILYDYLHENRRVKPSNSVCESLKEKNCELYLRSIITELFYYDNIPKLSGKIIKSIFNENATLTLLSSKFSMVENISQKILEISDFFAICQKIINIFSIDDNLKSLVNYSGLILTLHIKNLYIDNIDLIKPHSNLFKLISDIY